MGIDKFGRAPSSASYSHRPQRVGIQTLGFAITKTGDLNIESKRICNLGKPTASSDATTKLYVDDKIDNMKHEMRQKIFQLGNKLKGLQDDLQNIEETLTSLLKTGIIVANTTQKNIAKTDENSTLTTTTPDSQVQPDSVTKANKKMRIIY